MRKRWDFTHSEDDCGHANCFSWWGQSFLNHSGLTQVTISSGSQQDPWESLQISVINEEKVRFYPQWGWLWPCQLLCLVGPEFFESFWADTGHHLLWFTARPIRIVINFSHKWGKGGILPTVRMIVAMPIAFPGGARVFWIILGWHRSPSPLVHSTNDENPYKFQSWMRKRHDARNVMMKYRRQRQRKRNIRKGSRAVRQAQCCTRTSQSKWRI